MVKGRVPVKISLFDQYLQNTIAFLLLVVDGVTNWSLLGLTSQEKDKWIQYKDDWIELYPKYTNEAIRTKVITEDLGKLRHQATNFIEPILDRIDANPVTTNEIRIVFDIAPKVHSYTHRPKINDIPLFGLKPISNGDFKATARVSTDSTRASIHPDADGIEIIFMIGTTAPTSLNDLVRKEFSKKANFTLSVGSENTGKFMYYAVRWVNLSDKSKSSSYTSIQKIPVP